MKKIVLTLFILFSSHVSAQQWLCISDSAAGYKAKSWEPVIFSGGHKWLIKEAKGKQKYWNEDKNEDIKKLKYGLFEFGLDFPLAHCWVYEKRIVCDGRDIELSLEISNNRFLLSKTPLVADMNFFQAYTMTGTCSSL